MVKHKEHEFGARFMPKRFPEKADDDCPWDAVEFYNLLTEELRDEVDIICLTAQYEVCHLREIVHHHEDP